MEQIKEVEINSVIDYIKTIYSLQKEVKETFDVDLLYKIIDEINAFEKEVKELDSDNINNKEKENRKGILKVKCLK